MEHLRLALRIIIYQAYETTAAFQGIGPVGQWSIAASFS